MKILVATATYNEANNIRAFIARVRSTLGESQDILIVDDSSPDGTSSIVNEIKLNDSYIHLITRPIKAGLGSAHKLMKVYSMALDFDYLVTMDADLSHRPEEIPLLLKHAGANVFVIGSRYTPGGRSDYVGFRKMVSETGNFIVRVMLGIKLKEFTTSFRVFDVNLLKKSPLYTLKSNGYSYFVEVISLMDELGARLIEVPIHFKDRENDVSKIPKSQVVKSLFNLITLAVRRCFWPSSATLPRTDFSQCRLCGERTLMPVLQKNGDGRLDQLSTEDFKCSSVQNECRVMSINECLCCGLIQSSTSSSDFSAGDFYTAADDDTYLANFNVKLRTFRNAYKKLSKFLPGTLLSILDIGSYYGAFLDVVKAEGHVGYGIEPSRVAAQYSKDVLGHNVINGLFTGVTQFPEIKFDVISSWDVIEHLEDPEKFIADVEKLLKDDGIFVFSTIIVDSIIARILKHRWHWLIPMHLTYFKKREITSLLRRHGFEVMACLNHTHYASLRYAVRGAGMNMPLLMQKVCKFFATILPVSIVIPVALGDVMMFVCRKSSDNKVIAPESQR
jgi:2-polyprenyl-3-methyl-5-hydroxy-6-metoxy-1,4-benzoquinol methylase